MSSTSIIANLYHLPIWHKNYVSHQNDSKTVSYQYDSENMSSTDMTTISCHIPMWQQNTVITNMTTKLCQQAIWQQNYVIYQYDNKTISSTNTTEKNMSATDITAYVTI